MLMLWKTCARISVRTELRFRVSRRVSSAVSQVVLLAEVSTPALLLRTARPRARALALVLAALRPHHLAENLRPARASLHQEVLARALALVLAALRPHHQAEILRPARASLHQEVPVRRPREAQVDHQVLHPQAARLEVLPIVQARPLRAVHLAAQVYLPQEAQVASRVLPQVPPRVDLRVHRRLEVPRCHLAAVRPILRVEVPAGHPVPRLPRLPRPTLPSR